MTKCVLILLLFAGCTTVHCQVAGIKADTLKVNYIKPATEGGSVVIENVETRHRANGWTYFAICIATLLVVCIRIDLENARRWEALKTFLIVVFGLAILLSFSSCTTVQLQRNPNVDQIRARLSKYQVVRLSDFLDYAQECYNDSTDFGEDRIVRDIWVHVPYWHHRTPTFEGFVEYLKDKDALRQMRILHERMKENK
jgi:hypothetical protein